MKPTPVCKALVPAFERKITRRLNEKKSLRMSYFRVRLLKTILHLITRNSESLHKRTTHPANDTNFSSFWKLGGRTKVQRQEKIFQSQKAFHKYGWNSLTIRLLFTRRRPKTYSVKMLRPLCRFISHSRLIKLLHLPPENALNATSIKYALDVLRNTVQEVSLSLQRSMHRTSRDLYGPLCSSFFSNFSFINVTLLIPGILKYFLVFLCKKWK